MIEGIDIIRLNLKGFSKIFLLHNIMTDFFEAESSIVESSKMIWIMSKMYLG